MTKAIFKIAPGIIFCLLILQGCSKKDATDDAQHTYTEFDPATSYIAGTMSFSLDEIVTPYAIYLNTNDGLANVYSLNKPQGKFPYTLENKMLTIDYDGVKLNFDLNTAGTNGEIKTVTSSRVQKTLVNYAKVQKTSSPPAFNNTFFNKLMTGTIVSFEDFGPAYPTPTAVASVKYTGIYTQIDLGGGPSPVESKQLTNDVVYGSDASNSLLCLFVHINDYVEFGMLTGNPGTYYITRLKIEKQ